jgi:NADH:ubiquinone oxidoreductase subunit 5 (subunit L)/multisubunit Na+/H+ antiporter MnhA subunit
MFFLTFHGSFRGSAEAAVETTGHHPEAIDAETHEGGLHESDWWMTLPLIILAIPAALIGVIGSPFLAFAFQHFLEGANFQEEQITLLLPIIGSVLAIGGIIVAWVMYGAKAFSTEPLLKLGSLYTLLARRYYIDEFYMKLIDVFAIGVAAALAVFDREGLDRFFNGIGAFFAKAGQWLRGAQTGRVQNYGLVLFGGMAVIALALLFGPFLAPLVKK